MNANNNANNLMMSYNEAISTDIKLTVEINKNVYKYKYI